MTNHSSRILYVLWLLILGETVSSAVGKHGTPTLAFLCLHLYFQRQFSFLQLRAPDGQRLAFRTDPEVSLQLQLLSLYYLTSNFKLSPSNLCPFFHMFLVSLSCHFSFYWFYGWYDFLLVFSPIQVLTKLDPP